MVLLVAAGALFAYSWLRSVTSCAWATSDCAYSQTKNGVYEGRFPATGKRRSVAVDFGSRRGGSSVPLRAMADGRYCLVWAHERAATATAASGTPALGADGYRSVELGPWFSSRTVAVPPGCERASATLPWDHADDVRQTWEFGLLIGLSVIGFFGALGVLRVAPSRQEIALVVALVAVCATAVLSVTLWS